MKNTDNSSQLKSQKIERASNDITILHRAAQHGLLKEVKYLIEERNLDLEVTTTNNLTPLHFAVINSHIEVVEYLLDKRANIESRTLCDHATYLHIAARCNNVKAAKCLVKRGANIDAIDKDKNTPLHEAAKQDSLEVAKYLVEQTGANIEAKDYAGCTPWYVAASKGSARVANYLKAQKANTDVTSPGGQSPLHFAVMKENMQGVKYLVELGVNINCKDKNDFTPLHWASRRDNFELIKYLIDQGASIDLQNNHGRYPIHFFAISGELKLIKYLIDQKANPDVQDNEGYTPLHFVAERGHLETVKQLIKAGAKIDIKNSNKKTPLEVCLSRHSIDPDIQVKILKELIIRGAEPNFSDINFERKFKSQFDKILDICNDQQKILVLANITDTLDKHNNLRLKNWRSQLFNQLEEQIDKTIGYIIDNSYDRQKQIEICQESLELKPKIEDKSTVKPLLCNYYEVIDEFFPKRIASDAETYRIIFEYISDKREPKNDETLDKTQNKEESQPSQEIKPNITPAGQHIWQFIYPEDKKTLSYYLIPNRIALSYSNKKQQEPSSEISAHEGEVANKDIATINDSTLQHTDIIGQTDPTTPENA